MAIAAAARNERDAPNDQASAQKPVSSVSAEK